MSSLCASRTLLQELRDEVQSKKASSFEKDGSRRNGIKHPQGKDKSRCGKANTKGEKVGQITRMAA